MQKDNSRTNGRIFGVKMQPLPDAEIKLKFQKDQESLLRFRVNVILLMGIFLVPLFGVIDYFLYPEHFEKFFLYRGD